MKRDAVKPDCIIRPEAEETRLGSRQRNTKICEEFYNLDPWEAVKYINLDPQTAEKLRDMKNPGRFLSASKKSRKF